MNPESLAREPLHPAQEIVREVGRFELEPVNDYFNRLNKRYHQSPSYAVTAAISERLTIDQLTERPNRNLQGAFVRGGLLGLHVAQLEHTQQPLPLHEIIKQHVGALEWVGHYDTMSIDSELTLRFDMLRAVLHDYERQATDYHELITSFSPAVETLYGEDGPLYFQAGFGLLAGAKEHYETNTALQEPPAHGTLGQYITNKNVSRVQREN